MHDHDALENERKRLQERYDEQPDSRVFAPLADCLRKQGKLQEALGVCHTGLSKHPRYSSAYVILGKIHLERGDDGAAREAFLRVLEFDPQNLLALRQLAELDESREDFAAAVSRWELVTALEIDPAKAEERLEAARAKLDPPTDEETEEPIEDSVEETIEAPTPESAEAVDEMEEDPEDVPVDAAKAATSDLAALEDAVDDEGAADADEKDGPIDHTLVGSIEDRSEEVAESVPESPHEVDGDATVPSDSAMTPYVGSELEATSDELEDPVEDLSDVEPGDLDSTVTAQDPAESEAEVEPVTTSAAIAADDAIPTTEIATMTLAEIYAEQGFRQKALDILRQVLERNPGADKVARRIEELESISAEPVSEETANPGSEHESAATDSEPAPRAEDERPDLQADVERAIDPEPLTLTASETPNDPLEDGLDDGPEVEPAPPLTARTSPEAEEEDERERYGHFKNWLDRIRVDD